MYKHKQKDNDKLANTVILFAVIKLATIVALFIIFKP